MGMEQFYTRPKANEGRKLPLYAPDGSATDEWITVRHVWSDAFQDAEDVSLREMQEAMLAMGEKPDAAEVARIKREGTTRLLASLVVAWSFAQECTPDNVVAFLANAPQIEDQINRFAADAKGFFGSESRKPKRGSKAKSA